MTFKNQFDQHSKNIIVISYPPGGFGHFMYYVMTQYFSNTVKVDDSTFSFSDSGNAHRARKYTAEWSQDPDDYVSLISVPYTNSEKILVLCDNGFNRDNYTKINNYFTNATIVRMVIDEDAEPVIYKTYLLKTESGYNDIFNHKDRVKEHWSNTEDYSVREYFTFWYHSRPFAFKHSMQANVVNVNISKLITNPISTIKLLATDLGMNVVNPDKLLLLTKKWIRENSSYSKILRQWRLLERSLDNNTDIALSTITDLHDQGYINYRLEKKFNITIPVYDYRYWFKSSIEIKDMIKVLCLK